MIKLQYKIVGIDRVQVKNAMTLNHVRGAMSAAINRANNKGIAMMRRDIKARLSIRQAVKIAKRRRATRRSLTGYVSLRKAWVPIEKFKSFRVTDRGIRATVNRKTVFVSGAFRNADGVFIRASSAHKTRGKSFLRGTSWANEKTTLATVQRTSRRTPRYPLTKIYPLNIGVEKSGIGPMASIERRARAHGIAQFKLIARQKIRGVGLDIIF